MNGRNKNTTVNSQKRGFHNSDDNFFSATNPTLNYVFRTLKESNIVRLTK